MGFNQQETAELGLQVQLDDNRFVVGASPAKGNDFNGFYWILSNKGVDTHLKLTNEALDAMIKIRQELRSYSIDELRSQKEAISNGGSK
jgi:hypothetical protein